jgi:HAMP domain-containing protein
MEEEEVVKAAESKTGKAGNYAKWSFVIVIALAAGIIGFFTIFRTHAAQATVERAFDMVEQGDIDGVMDCIDPLGELGRLWAENTGGVRDSFTSFLEDYLLEFSSLKFATRVEGDAAEVELNGGRVTVYHQGEEGAPAASLDLGNSDLVFYVERREGLWLIEGVNYDLAEMLSGEQDFFPF